LIFVLAVFSSAYASSNSSAAITAVTSGMLMNTTVLTTTSENKEDAETAIKIETCKAKNSKNEFRKISRGSGCSR